MALQNAEKPSNKNAGFGGGGGDGTLPTASGHDWLCRRGDRTVHQNRPQWMRLRHRFHPLGGYFFSYVALPGEGGGVGPGCPYKKL